ncbi:MAG: DUF3991 and toprim domain-containing protein, partial [Oscillospiraceae bacterium]|nr:DUF3991 and toprim domain-containing protein [Oscillospiraceae bacterium]
NDKSKALNGDFVVFQDGEEVEAKVTIENMSDFEIFKSLDNQNSTMKEQAIQNEKTNELQQPTTKLEGIKQPSESSNAAEISQTNKGVKQPHETYSPHQITQARETDMINFLERKENFTFKKTGGTWKCDQHDSLVIMKDRTGWFWNSQQIGGANAIDWCKKIYNHTFGEAMQMIVGSGDVVSSNHVYSSARGPAESREREFVLPESAADNKRVFAYLTKTRDIDPAVVNSLIKSNQLYQDNRGNCVFVGYNANTAKYAGLRGTLSDDVKPCPSGRQSLPSRAFRGEVTGSDKRFSFSMKSRSSSEKNQAQLYIFESPIEAISHASLVNHHVGNDKAHTLHNRLSLGGVTDVALVQYLQDNPQIKELVFCLNNDDAGRSATSELMKKFSAQGYTVKDRPPKLGDFNEDLKADKIVNQVVFRSAKR